MAIEHRPIFNGQMIERNGGFGRKPWQLEAAIVKTPLCLNLGDFSPVLASGENQHLNSMEKKGYHILSHKPMFCPKSYLYYIYSLPRYKWDHPVIKRYKWRYSKWDNPSSCCQKDMSFKKLRKHNSHLEFSVDRAKKQLHRVHIFTSLAATGSNCWMDLDEKNPPNDQSVRVSRGQSSTWKISLRCDASKKC